MGGRDDTVSVKLRMDRNFRVIVKRFPAEDSKLVKVSGSHHKFRKGPMTVIVPHPKKDLPLGTARAIARLEGWI